MPECVEAETARRQLQKALLGQRLISLLIHDNARIEAPPGPHWRRGRLTSLTRIGKTLGFVFDQEREMTVSLGMSGSLQLVAASLEKRLPHERLRLRFEGYNCALIDPRRFARIGWGAGRPRGWDILGSINEIQAPLLFYQALKNTSMKLKIALMDQSKIAGLGNVYANEALFEAGLRPQRCSNALNKSEIKRLWQALGRVLSEALALGGISMRNYEHPDGGKGNYQKKFRIYGHAGELCPRCARVIRRVWMGQRSTFYCSGCQQ